jgi:hypothetical protein
MKIHIATLSLRKHQAIAALITHGVAEAALICGTSAQILGRWMKDPVFSAALRAARRADFRHQKARLRQGVKGAVFSLLTIAANPAAKASNRFNAAKQLISIAEYAGEREDFLAEVTELESATRGAKLPAGGSVKSPRTGHGAKYPRKKQQAIIELFQQRSIAEAARKTGVGLQTLYRWMEEPEFVAECRAFERSTFGEALTLAQQKTGDLMMLIRNFSLDRTVPDATRNKANDYIYSDAKANALEDTQERLSEQERAKAISTDEPAETSKTIGRDLRQRLRRLQALLPGTWCDETQYIHAVDGRPAGCSVIGAEGWHKWSKPPEGSKVGDRVPDKAAA